MADGGGILLVQLMQIFYDPFIHCYILFAKQFRLELFFISCGMLFQMTEPEYEILSL